MKGKILVDVENEEDLQQLHNELEAAIAHTTHLEGDIEVLEAMEKTIDGTCQDCGLVTEDVDLRWDIHNDLDELEEDQPVNANVEWTCNHCNHVNSSLTIVSQEKAEEILE